MQEYLKSEKNVTDDEFKKFQDAILEGQNIEKNKFLNLEIMFFQTNAIESDVKTQK